MKFFSLFSEKNVFMEIDVSLKKNILSKVISSIIPDIKQDKINYIIGKIIEHESSPLYNISEDVVVPHARIEEIEDFYIALVISKDGLLWEEIKGKQRIVNLIFVIITPSYQNMKMIQTLDAISRFCELKHNIEALSNIKSETRAISFLEESGIDVKNKLTAEFLMNTDFVKLSPDMSLRDASTVLVKYQEDALPVVNDKNELIGEFTSEAILKIGVPNYMNIISNVDFISNFEPFENYYKKERFTKIGEILSERMITTPPDASVIEVAYQLVSAGLRRIYVVENKKLVGIIYRRDIVSKILLA